MVAARASMRRPIAPDGVDFPVVSQGPQRLGPIPRGHVGGIALVEDGEGGRVGRVGQVRIELRQQAAGTHGLVDHGIEEESEQT